MTLTVVVPNYNNENYIVQCLNSILNQSHQPDEIIITDDASTDNSLDILKDYEDNYDTIKVLYHSKNTGVSENRHKGIMAASSEYITCLDSDDYYINDKKLENEIRIINDHKYDPNGCIAYSNTVYVDIEGTKIGDMCNLSTAPEGYVLKNVLSRKYPIPNVFIFKKEYYIDVGCFNTDLKIYEDWDLKIRLAEKYNFYYTGDDGAAYRKHGSGLSSEKRLFHIKKLLYVFNLYIGKLKKGKIITILIFYSFIFKFIFVGILKFLLTKILKLLK